MAEEKEINFEDLFADELGIKESPTAEESESDEGGQSERKTVEDPDLNVEDILRSSTDPDTPGEEEGQTVDSEDVRKDGGDSPVSDSSPSGKSSENQDSATLLFARFLSEQGNLTSFNEEEFRKLVEEKGDEEALSSLWNKEAEAIRNNLLDTYDKDVKEYLDMLDTGIAPDVAKNISQSKKWIASIKPEDIESEDKEDLRKDLIRQRYRVTTSFSDAKIDKLVERAISLGEDVEEAAEALEDLTKYYDEKIEQEKKYISQQEEEGKKSAQKQLEEFKEKVTGMKEVVPGMELTAKQKQNIIDKLTKPVKELNGQPVNHIWAKRAEDPFKFDTIVAALEDLGIFDGKWDKLQKRVKTDTVNQLKKSIEQQSSQRTRTGAYGSYDDDRVQKSIDSMKGLI